MKKEELINKTIPANLNPKYRVLIRNANCYHVATVKVLPTPGDPKHPVIRPRLMVLRPCDYEKYFLCSDKENIENLKTMNFEAPELVHDPTKNSPDVKAILQKIAEDDQARNEKDLQVKLMLKSKVKAYN
jgi:hypothetical protein